MSGRGGSQRVGSWEKSILLHAYHAIYAKNKYKKHVVESEKNQSGENDGESGCYLSAFEGFSTILPLSDISFLKRFQRNPYFSEIQGKFLGTFQN